MKAKEKGIREDETVERHRGFDGLEFQLALGVFHPVFCRRVHWIRRSRQARVDPVPLSGSMGTTTPVTGSQRLISNPERKR